MAKKKQGSSAKPTAPSKAAPAKKNGNGMIVWVIALVAVIAVVGVVVSQNAGGKKGSVAAAPADEKKYIGRFLPSGYAEAKISDAVAYNQVIQMSPTTAASGKDGTSIPLSDVTSKKIVSFEASSKSGQTIPMVAYVKPSGKLFVGVSYCIPCKGTGQRIETDGTLTCETCGTKRSPETQVGISGACKLYPLDEIPAKVSGDKIVVDQTVLDQWTPQPTDRQIGG